MRGTRGLAIGVLAALAILQLFVGLGSYGLMDPDEPRYAEGARSLSGPDADPFMPHFNGVPRLVKPILAYWAISASYAVFGVNEWGARFPSALAGLIIVLLVFDLGRRLVDSKTGWLSAIVALTSLILVAMSRLVTTDALLVCFITLAVYAHVLVRQAEPGKAGPTLLLWTALALAMATKGPVGVLVPSIIILASSGVRHGYGRVLLAGLAVTVGFLIASDIGFGIGDKTGRVILGGAQITVVLLVIGLGARLLRREPETLVVPVALGIVLAVGLILMRVAAGRPVLTARVAFLVAASFGFVALLFLAYRRDREATRRRYLTTGLAIFVVLGLFWYAVVVLRDRSIAELFLRETEDRYTADMEAHLKPSWFFLKILLGGFLPWSIALIPASIFVLRREDGMRRSLPFVWLIAVVVFFSLSPNKLESYMLPAAPGVALLVGIWLRRGIGGEAPSFPRWILGLAAGLQAAVLIAGFALPEESAPGGRPIALAAAGLLSIGTIGAIVGLRRPAIGVAGLVLGLVLAVAYAAFHGLPMVEAQRSERALAPILAEYPDAELVCHHKLKTGLVFYGRRQVVEAKFTRRVVERMKQDHLVLAWVESENADKLLRLYAEATKGMRRPPPLKLHESPKRILFSNGVVGD
jgi:4-amino-4-deoxy-L-arabinose transferase-like glycosyltransferase